MGVGRGAAPPRRTAPGPAAPARRRRRSAASRADAAAPLLARVRAAALPGFARAARFDLLTALGAAGRYELEAGELHLTAGEDATTEAAKRLLVGDKLLLEAARATSRGGRGAARGADRALALGHAGRPPRPGRRGARADPGGSPPVSAQAVPAPPRAAAARADDRGRAAPRLPMAVLLLACLALAALPAAASTPTYDPWAWIIWGREITVGTS